jgi:hypothetical protein
LFTTLIFVNGLTKKDFNILKVRNLNLRKTDV